MKKAKVLIYDGSFNGFLTSIFVAFQEEVSITDIRKNNQVQNGLFSEVQTVFTQMDKAKRVWNGIQAKSHTAIKEVYFAFLSESNGIEMILYRYIRSLFASNPSVAISGSEDLHFKIEQLSKMTGREKHRLEASLNFEQTKDGVLFTTVEPDFNILPLISKFFRSKYSGWQWMIYDNKRNYGLFYDGFAVEIISLDLKELYGHNSLNTQSNSRVAGNNMNLEDRTIRNTNIKPLINQKLHRQTPSRPFRKYRSAKTAV